LVELCRRLEQPGLPGIDASMQPLFREVSDHIRRVQEEIESIREVLAFAFAISLMAGQAQQTEITGPFPNCQNSRCATSAYGVLRTKELGPLWRPRADVCRAAGR
jgi:hypothetical protein